VTLRDPSGKAYPRKTFPGAEVAGQVHRASIYPGQFKDDLLVFEPPPADVEYLRLELPAANAGAAGLFRLTIPKSIIRRPGQGEKR
jgi:hypothetical protein